MKKEQPLTIEDSIWAISYNLNKIAKTLDNIDQSLRKPKNKTR